MVPLAAGIISRNVIAKNKGLDYFENEYIPKFNNVTTIDLLLTLINLFSFQGQTIINNPLDILLIAVPLTIQIFLIFFIAYLWSKAWRFPFDVAAPAVGVLTEVPIMLSLVNIANKTNHWFAEPNNK